MNWETLAKLTGGYTELALGAVEVPTVELALDQDCGTPLLHPKKDTLLLQTEPAKHYKPYNRQNLVVLDPALGG